MDLLFYIAVAGLLVVGFFSFLFEFYWLLILAIPFLYLLIICIYDLIFYDFRLYILKKFGKTTTATIVDSRICHTAEDGGYTIFFKYSVQGKIYFKEDIFSIHWGSDKDYEPYEIGKSFTVYYLFFPRIFKHYQYILPEIKEVEHEE